LNFKYYFNDLSKREQILSFLLVPLILSFVYFTFDKYILTKNKQNIINKTIILQNKLKDLSQIQQPTKLNHLDIIRHIETLASQLNINISNLNINQKIFGIEALGAYYDVMDFISNLEQNMKIVNFTLSLYGKQIKIKISLEPQYLSNLDSLILLDNIPNPFHTKKTRSSRIKLKLSAIIGQNICINHKWYSKDDNVGKYKIVGIDDGIVKLLFKDKIIMLRLENDQ